MCWIASDYEAEEAQTGRNKAEIPFVRIKEVIQEGPRTKNKISTMLADEFKVATKTVSRRIDNLIENNTVGVTQEGDLTWRC